MSWYSVYSKSAQPESYLPAAKSCPRLLIELSICIELHRLDKADAVKLIERVLHQAHVDVKAQREAIEDLVDAVNGHARTLALLAPNIQQHGVAQTHADMAKLMAQMERDFPGQREQSLFASVELSLLRLSPESREKVRVLGVFHGVANLAVFGLMMSWDKSLAEYLAKELLETGLAKLFPYNHLRLHPALCPYLYVQLSADERQDLENRWQTTMRSFVAVLERQQSEDIQLAATLDPT
ncbi:MAG: hypothetical protein R3F53_05655 [Gammaproteobacteria bacterium]